jgi:hypothetical protein
VQLILKGSKEMQMKIKIIQFLKAIGFFIMSGHLAQAGCDPCICGPSGSYQGDLNEWWQNNCPGRFPGNIGTKKFIGHYEVVGTCKLIQRNRTMVRMEIQPAYASAKLPVGSIVVTFQKYEDFDTDYFSTFIVPGSGTIKDPESSDRNPVQMTYLTEVKNGVSSQNTHHERMQDRVEFLSFAPSVLGGPIWDLHYTAGWYEPLDKCQFVKTN